MTENDRPVPPPVDGILETVLYFSDQERSERFYSDVLGLRLLDREPGRSLFYRVGAGVLLLFRPDVTRAGATLPPHGADGPIHLCLRVPSSAYAEWKRHLAQAGVILLHEARWQNGLSFYFEDPDGNLLEIANADIWPA